MKLFNAKGTRDFPPEEKIMRQEVVDTLRKIFESFGFAPLETPLLERLDILASKYSGGAEILKETFTLTDQGGRKLGLRYDLTVPFARFVGMNPHLKMPFKRYAIGRVFRDGPVKLGRYREFLQCDVDIVGTSSMRADAQCIELAQQGFAALDLEVAIEVNNRKLMDGLLESLRIPENKKMDVILAIDKLKKVGVKEVEEELKKKDLLTEQIDKLLKILIIEGTNIQKIEKLRPLITSQKGIEGLNEIEELLRYLDIYNVEFSISLARGLSYYTGTVFEAFLKEGTVTSSLCGGGRYDNMIGDFLGKGSFPAVGISFGVEPIVEELKARGKKGRKSLADVFVIPIKTVEDSLKIAAELRDAGINTDIDLLGRGISKNLEYASALGIPYVAIIGKKELEGNYVTLRNMDTGKEEQLTVVEVCARLSEDGTNL